ncbi:MAG: hypothetical protein ACXADB_00590 [Candidatus Hermodarchaeia archaeon]|jgi:uncharacterized coiled-coil protein SlyX
MSAISKLERDAARLDNQRIKSGAYTESIIQEQENLVAVSQTGINRINADLRALRNRLKMYTGTKPKPIDEKYSDLKHRYESKLGERAVLQNAISIAEESITAARLSHIPGEDVRA